MITEVFFDVETKKLFGDLEVENPGDLGVSILSLYKRQLNENLNEVEGQMFSFWENELDQVWPIFQSANRIIGFNTIGFDVPVLKPYASFAIDKLPHFDIMQKFKEKAGHRISLDSLAKVMLGREKTDVGTDAVIYYQKGDEVSLAKLKKYCEADVLITKDIYDLILKQGFVSYKDKWNTERKLDLDFGYPKSQEDQNQMGLF